MQPQHPSSTRSGLVTLAASAGLIAVFYFGREVLIPLALAVLLSFLLMPGVRRFEGWGVGRALSVGVVTVIATVPVVVLAWVIATQFLDLAATLPKYQDRIEQKLQSISGPAGGAFSRISKTIRELGEEARRGTADPAPDGAGAAQEPLPVRIVGQPFSPVDLVRNFIQPLARPLATAGIVLVFVIVILIHREDLRDRLIRLIGHGNLTVTTRALDELAGRVSRFLRMQFIVNLTYGIAVAIGLSVIGVPSAVFWGFMCLALRFMPYLGPIVAAAMPITLSLAISDGWALPIQTSVFFIILELVSNNLVEPWLYGKKTGVSVLAILFAALFWTWLWGLPGLFLSTPMTVCLVVAGRYVPQLAFLQIILGDQPVLPPGARIYQRLLALDSDEAMAVADAYMTDHSLEDLYDNVLVDVLDRVGEDREVGTIDPGRERLVIEALMEVVDEAAAKATLRGPPPDANRTDLRTLCLPARDESDAAGARMLANLLIARGITARALTLEDLGSDLGAVMTEFRPDLLVVSASQPHASARARLRVRQIVRKAPGARVMVGLWGEDRSGAPTTGRERLSALGAAGVFASLAAAAERISQLATMPGTRPDHVPVDAA